MVGAIAGMLADRPAARRDGAPAAAGGAALGAAGAGGVRRPVLAMILWLAGYKYTLASIAAVLNETASVSSSCSPRGG
jgi:hypothetical protein